MAREMNDDYLDKLIPQMRLLREDLYALVQSKTDNPFVMITIFSTMVCEIAMALKIKRAGAIKAFTQNWDSMSEEVE